MAGTFKGGGVPLAIFGALGLVGLMNFISPDSPQTAERSNSTGTQMYAHGTVNVRSGRGTEYQAAGQLRRGQSVRVEDEDDGWGRVSGGMYEGNYVSVDVLENSPLPPFEIASSNWRSDPNFGGNGAVRWSAEVRNNTREYVDRVWLEVTTYDANGNIITTTTGVVTGLQPGGTAATSGFATYYGNEHRGRIRIR